MEQYFHIITEKNKFALNKPQDKDVVYYSELNEWDTSNAFRSFSLKYVIDRCIYYKAGNKEYAVNKGNYLLACKQPYVHAYFESRQPVKSICIDICPTTVAEAFTVLTARDDHALDNYLSGYFRTPEFFETVNPVCHSPFKKKIDELVTAITGGEGSEHVSREWFMDLVEMIVWHEYGNYISLNGIRSLKAETRKEILRRLKTAQQYMDDQYLHIGDIKQVASFCTMSEFHFFRSFKQAFGVSPYQYLLGKRLELAKELMMTGEMTITQVALHCSFPDLFTFSKAFKRKFKLSPSSFIASNKPI
ncbi:MAG: helix-turn-helix transcriptional regulator [Chitinophagaceae bacterium]|nr:helix-turn-helix transcriptional regulator [Chitinophagaceae bacterium]